MQIFITADNFVFRATNLEGGFAIIDDIEYYGDLCTNPNNMMPPKVFMFIEFTCIKQYANTKTW